MAKETKFVDFGGERIEVPADSNPRTAGQASMLRQKMFKERRASAAPTESPRPAPRPSGTRTPGNSQRASNAPSRPSQRPPNSQSVAGDPRTSNGYNRIGASMAPTQNRTRSLPSAPSGSNVTRTAGSQADTSPRRTPPRQPQTPERDSFTPRQSDTRAPVRAKEITTLAQWKALTREQRRNTPGVPDTMLDAIRKYGL
jgi:hypothetical protein